MIRFFLRLILILGTPLLIAAVTYLFLHHAFLTPLAPGRANPVTVEVAPGDSFASISRKLKDQHVIRYAWTLELLARFKKADTKIKAGEYEVSAALTPREILAKLMSGEILKRLVTVKEGTSIWELGKIIEEKGLLSTEEFNAALRDPNLLARAGISASSFEGYLFPETYQFSRPITAAEVLWRMMEEGDKHWNPDFTAKADELRMSRHEILTLASIVEKESGSVDEQPLIASVFHNRLAKGMKLQSDPTVIYGIPNFNGNLTKDDLQSPHPYNTYVNYGLPPGPIANPGESAVRAALFPATTPYLFFVADGAGKHIFSTTLQEHNEAVALYQKGGAAKKAEATGTPAPPTK